MIDEKQSFEDIYFELAGTDSISEREVEWQIPEQEVIHNALYSNALRVNQVIGPLLTEDGFYIVMKVKGWTDRVVITEKDINQRVSDVELTRIDMFVTQRNMPFPIVVPSFPQVTTDPWLDYGKKMD